MRAAAREGAKTARTGPMTGTLDDLARAIGALREPADGFPGQRRPEGVSIDTRTIRPGALFWVLRGPRFDGHDFVADAFQRGAAGAVVEHLVLPASPTRPMLVVDDSLAALHAAAASARRDASHASVVAVTGSNGKTTTRSMLELALAPLGSVLATSGNRNNHIGLPLTMLELSPEHRVAIFELGMNHVGEIHTLSRLARPHIALITNVGRAHVGPVGGLENVRRAKLEILDGLEAGGVLFLPSTDAALLESASGAGVRVETVGPGDATHAIEAIRSTEDGCTMLRMRGGPDVRLNGPGRAVGMAAAFAFAAARVLGVDDRQAARALETWQPVAGRLSIRRVGGITLLDDSYNANPDSMRVALDTLRAFPGARRRIAVLGDMGELGDTSDTEHARLVASLSDLDAALVVGEAMQRAVLEAGTPVPHAPDAEAALGWLRRESRAGDVVLIKASRSVGLDTVVDAFAKEGSS